MRAKSDEAGGVVPLRVGNSWGSVVSQRQKSIPPGLAAGGCRVVGALGNSRFGAHQQAGNRRPVPKWAADELGSIHDDIWHDRCAFLKFVAPAGGPTTRRCRCATAGNPGIRRASGSAEDPQNDDPAGRLFSGLCAANEPVSAEGTERHGFVVLSLDRDQSVALTKGGQRAACDPAFCKVERQLAPCGRMGPLRQVW